MIATDLRRDFATLYSGAPARPLPTPAWLRGACDTLHGAGVRLLLPRYTASERAHLLASDTRGLHERMLALQRVLAQQPALAAALAITSQAVSELQHKDCELAVVQQRGLEIAEGAERCERRAGSQLKRHSLQVLATAARLRDDPRSDAVTRGEAAELLAVIEHSDWRLQRTARRRRLRQQRLPAPPPAASRRRPAAPGAPEVRGAPAERCLQAPAAAVAAIKDALAAIAAGLDDPSPAVAPDDYLYHSERGALLALLLAQCPQVQAACPVRGDALATLCAQVDDCRLLAELAHLLASMAGDGHLHIAALTHERYEAALRWLQAQAADPALSLEQQQRLSVEALRLQQVQDRVAQRQQDRRARAERRLAAAGKVPP